MSKNRQNPIDQPNPPAASVSIESKSFSGPLPHPEILVQYDKIVSGSAERIISIWEGQVRHRQELEKKVIESDIKQSQCGAILGFLIAIAAISAGTFLAYIGRPTEGLAAIITALGGLVGVYVWGSYQRRKERSLRANQ